jgi:hypothetical protein
MTAKERKKGSKLARSETVTIRLDPKMRYLAELASRVHRRTLSSYIEWAIEASFSQIRPSPSNQHVSLSDVASALWDVYEPDRFVTLASRYPDLLTHEEQRRWKLIRENGFLWHGWFEPDGGVQNWAWGDDPRTDLHLERLREHWDDFVAVARDEAPSSKLPTWPKTRPIPPRIVAEDEDDDLPF